jgi:NAD(P)-dependent dehydrogenase (short-subunit alcohol dehydrogenase family)
MKLDSTISAIVTGGASGLGEATARVLAEAGVRVAIFDRQRPRGAAIAAEIGGLFCSVDVTDSASVDAGLQAARSAHGIERVLVNCAGIVIAKRVVSKRSGGGDFVAHDLTAFEQTVWVNLVGTFQMVSKSAAAMASLGPVNEDGCRGVLINTSSVAAQDGQIGQAAYAASKAGVLGMTLPIARDLAGVGIRVMTIMPGVFETPMFDALPEAARAALAASVPFPRRLGRPSEYAALVKFICENDMLNGEAVRLDGAIRMGMK